MRCRRCQHENEAGAKFCEECAAPLVRACRNCGRQLSATAKFCPECAQPTGSSAEPSTVPRFASPESYTPKHLAERIVNSKPALEGERKQDEDLHWIDAETQAVLDGLVDTLPTARILLLMSYRPEYRHAWSGKTYYLQTRLDPLREASAIEPLDTLLGPEASLGPLKRLIIERTEGNPFFLEESVRTLVETGVLGGQAGAYQLSRALETIQVPPTVQAVLAARIDRLAPADKTLLHSASVVGKDVPFALLNAVADVPEDTLREQIGRLQAAEFLYETKLFPDLEYTFKHAVTHDVTYGTLLSDRRRALHGRIVDASRGSRPIV